MADDAALGRASLYHVAMRDTIIGWNSDMLASGDSGNAAIPAG